ncbi:hypothetical protein HN604_00995 [archaeon]|jgi:hypothetical protein|nr:hypothetical protein [archaeon]MBT6183109.1 hypothetical protein [archaeon]MBT6606716.1 hypothetical protein [archaeon]MBT7251959.1 hypothetical protein [archaeon]MBT7660640.1 hypothetical protein [archaeon]
MANRGIIFLVIIFLVVLIPSPYFIISEKSIQDSEETYSEEDDLNLEEILPCSNEEGFCELLIEKDIGTLEYIDSIRDDDECNYDDPCKFWLARYSLKNNIEDNFFLFLEIQEDLEVLSNSKFINSLASFENLGYTITEENYAGNNYFKVVKDREEPFNFLDSNYIWYSNNKILSVSSRDNLERNNLETNEQELLIAYFELYPSEVSFS